MKELDNCVVMTKDEVDKQLSSQSEKTYRNGCAYYSKGEIEQKNGNFYMCMKKEGCLLSSKSFAPGSNWKKVIFLTI